MATCKLNAVDQLLYLTSTLTAIVEATQAASDRVAAGVE